MSELVLLNRRQRFCAAAAALVASSTIVLSTLMVFLESDSQRALIARGCVRAEPGAAHKYDCKRQLARETAPAAAIALQLAAY
ncbi:MAG: hypothetical protein LC125_03815 [Burkholderiales bacterium]|nr:hypothetical protein [Burkholderiales bacterium]